MFIEPRKPIPTNIYRSQTLCTQIAIRLRRTAMSADKRPLRGQMAAVMACSVWSFWHVDIGGSVTDQTKSTNGGKG